MREELAKRAAMRRLRQRLVDSVDESRPTSRPSVEELFPVWCALLSQDREHTVDFELVAFPPAASISGAYFRGQDRDLIVVEAKTSPFHQITIFGHEIFHLYRGGCRKLLPQGPPAATRLLTQVANQQAVLEALECAARSSSENPIERRADRFGVLLSAQCRCLLAPTSQPGTTPLAERIRTSLVPAEGRP
ncbi:hypothetical protein [Streptomyces sp. NPDC059003]|uniref:hypothetical protein n=1 Tax=Streptomyces sp. NPDC059003 TaxID=3346691 RepID=UPI0036B5B663